MSRVEVNPRVRNLHEVLSTIPHTVAIDVMNGIDNAYRRWETALFANEGGGVPERAPWQDLSPEYKKWKKKNYPGRKILALTGEMRRAFVSMGGGHIARVSKTATGWRVTVGAAGPYWWKFHEEGGPVPGRPPQRDQQQTGSTLKRILTKVSTEALTTYLARIMRAQLTARRFSRGR